ncbi:MAG: hypothetical protein FWH37_09815 [Candidatus Bathyarchaeota archaeon]|nr:hypothetical protein [Candidatus Termiticorpusculum sp.]
MKISNNVVFVRFFVVILLVCLFMGLMPLLSMTYTVWAVDQNSVPKNAIHIKNVDELAIIGGDDSEGGYYILDNDINLKDEWVPIDDFRGTFDGNGYSINNLYVLENSKKWCAGLFGRINVSDVVIKNVGVNIHSKGLTVSTSSVYDYDYFDENADLDYWHSFPIYAGGLVGYAIGDIVVVNCYVTGNVAANLIQSPASFAYVGGLVGNNMCGTTIENCHTTGDITITIAASSSVAYAGGLIGYNYGSVSVVDSYTVGNVTVTAGAGFAGGLIGSSGFDDVIVKNSYATGDITATVTNAVCVGGLIGENYGGGITVKNSYATGDITTHSSSDTGILGAIAGGLVGRGCRIVENSYATGNIKVTASLGHVIAGGLIGGGIAVKNCYATGNITASSGSGNVYAGGLVGYGGNGASMENSDIVDSYVTGNIIATSSLGDCDTYAGSLVGYTDDDVVAIITCCYRLSSQKIIGDTIDDAGKPLSLFEMRNQQSFIGWNFKTIWTIDPTINEGYPHLTMDLPINSNSIYEWGLLKSFWFVTLLVVVVLVIIVVVYASLKKKFK